MYHKLGMLTAIRDQMYSMELELAILKEQLTSGESIDKAKLVGLLNDLTRMIGDLK